MEEGEVALRHLGKLSTQERERAGGGEAEVPGDTIEVFTYT